MQQHESEEVTIFSSPAKTPQRDAEGTRGRILSAAMTLFSDRGYGQTGVRDIAAQAGVNPALVARYFGSKEALFRAALNGAMVMELLLEIDRDRLGERIAELFSSEHRVDNPLSMILLSIADPAARAISIEILETRVIEPLAAYLGPPDAEARAARLNILWSGFLTARQLLPLSALADTRLPPMLDWLAEQTQMIVDEGTAA